MKKFQIKAAFTLNVNGEFVKFAAGEYEAKSETEIKALCGSKGAILIGEGKSPTKEEKHEPEPDKGEDEELLQLRAEYLAKIGKKPHHLAGKDKLKALIADFDNKQED